MTGWGTRDTHALASNLKYGFDNWCGARSAIRASAAPSAARNCASSRRSIASRPTARQMRAHGELHEQHVGPRPSTRRSTSSDRPRTTSTASTSRFRCAYYEGVPGLRGDGKKKIDGHYAMQANTQKIRQVDSQGGFTAAAGPQLLHGARVPRGVLEPRRVRERADRARHPPRDHHAEGLRLRGSPTAGTSVASDDEWYRAGARGSRPGRRALVRRLLRLHRAAQPDAGRRDDRRLSRIRTDAATRTTRRCATRIAAASTGSSGRARSRTRRSRSAQTRPARTGRDAQERQHVLAHSRRSGCSSNAARPTCCPSSTPSSNDRTVDKIGLNSPAVHALWTMHGPRRARRIERRRRSTSRSAR